jgi:predicted kinase
MIHGYLGAGKTTFARRLEQELSAIRFTHDQWMARLYGIDPPAERFADYGARVSAQIDSLWPRCLQLGLDVVLDLNFWTRRRRDATRMKAQSLGAAVRLYRLACPDGVAWRRIERRNASLDGSSLFIARKTFEGLRARFEPLDPDEEREEIALGRGDSYQ